MSESTHELIRQLQICSRSAARLPKYDPSDPTLPRLPSLSTTIASLNHPSQPDPIRCDNCKAKFLRGIQSNTCVYCGKYRQNDVVLDPICFVSTIGYRWLIRYLGLDGSEIVKLPTDKTKREHGKRSPIAKVHLSDFLNVKVTWEAVINKKETTVSDERAGESTRSFTLNGFAPDDFFFKFNKDASITSSEQPITDDQIPHDSQDLFETLHSSDQAGVSLKAKNTEPLSEWKADFQFADSSSQHGVSSSLDPFMGTSTEPANNVQESEPLNSSPGFSDLNSDEQGNILSSKDENKSDNPNDLSASVDFFDDFKWQTSNTNTPENITVEEEHKLVHQHGVSSSPDPFMGTSTDPANNVQESEPLNSSPGFSDMNSNEQGNILSSKDENKSDNPNDLSASVDFFDDFKWQTSNTNTPENITVEEEQKLVHQHGVSSSSDPFTDTSVDPSNNVQDSETLNSFAGFSDLNLDEQGNNLSSTNEKKSDGLNDISASVNFLDDFEWQTSENITVGEEHKPEHQEGVSSSSDPFMGTSTDPANNVHDSEPLNSSPGFSDLNLDEQGNILSTTDVNNLDTPNDLSASVNFLDNFEWQTSNTNTLENIMVGEEHKPTRQQGVSSPSDPFMGTSIDPVNIVQGSDPLNSFPGFSDLNINEQGNILSSKDENKSDGPHDLSASVSFFDDFEWQTSNTNAPENITVGEEHKPTQESFNDWDDFIGSSKNVGDVSHGASTSDKKSAEMDTFNWSS